MKYLKSFIIFEWQHNVELDQFNTANNNYDGNSNWTGTDQTSSPDKSYISGDFDDDDFERINNPDDDSINAYSKIKPKNLKKEKEIDKIKASKKKKELEIMNAFSAPDFLTSWKKFLTKREPGKAG